MFSFLLMALLGLAVIYLFEQYVIHIVEIEVEKRLNER